MPSVVPAMQAVEISAFGAPDVLRLGERPVPVAGAGEVLIRVSASGVNRPDVLQRTGNYPVTNSPEQFAAFIRKEADRWSRVIKETGIKLD